jgi:hypothetical protein
MSFPMYSQDEFDKRLIAWQTGKLLIQEAFPEISPSAREFIMTGLTQEEWDNMLGRNDERESAMEKWENTTEIFF